MLIQEIGRKSGPSGELISIYNAGELKINLISAFGEGTVLEDLIFNIACQRIDKKMRDHSKIGLAHDVVVK